MERFREHDTVLKASILALSGFVVIFTLVAIVTASQNRSQLDQRPGELAASIASTSEEKKAEVPFPTTIVGARAAIVVDLNTQETIYEKNADTVMPLASVTKLMTAYVAASELELTARHTIDSVDLEPDGDWGVLYGDTLSIEDLLGITLVASSNDMANALAHAAGEGSVSAFVKKMNEAAAEMGAKGMRFANPSGLDTTASKAGAEGSARDVATLLETITRQQLDMARVSSKESFVANGAYGTEYAYKNTNDVVGEIPGLLISKTGYTDLAGGNLAIVFDAGVNQPFAIVVLGSTQTGRFEDVTALASSTVSYLHAQN
jgi:D-alanyl-D-alanine carboxypeptidase